jgi:phage repressor protein C with HTH and peptisase S24 domain
MYAVAVEDLVYLKQVNAEQGKLVLTSANPAYTRWKSTPVAIRPMVSASSVGQFG